MVVSALPIVSFTEDIVIERKKARFSALFYFKKSSTTTQSIRWQREDVVVEVKGYPIERFLVSFFLIEMKFGKNKKRDEELS